MSPNERRIRSRKAQLFSIDLVFAMLAFSSLIGAFVLINSKVSSRTGDVRLEASLSDDSQRAIRALLTTPGSPSNWTREGNSSRILGVGIASSRFSIDSGKLSALSALNSTNYSRVKSLLGLSKPGYDFEVSLKYGNGTTAPIFGIKKPLQNMTSSVSNYFSSLEGETVLVTLNLWVNSSKVGAGGG